MNLNHISFVKAYLHTKTLLLADAELGFGKIVIGRLQYTS